MMTMRKKVMCKIAERFFMFTVSCFIHFAFAEPFTSLKSVYLAFTESYTSFKFVYHDTPEILFILLQVEVS